MCKKSGEEKEARRFVLIDTNNENGEDDKRTIMESDVIRLKGICRRRERAIRARTRLYTFV